HSRSWQTPRRRQGIHHARWRRVPLPVQRVIDSPAETGGRQVAPLTGEHDRLPLPLRLTLPGRLRLPLNNSYETSRRQRFDRRKIGKPRTRGPIPTRVGAYVAGTYNSPAP